MSLRLGSTFRALVVGLGLCLAAPAQTDAHANLVRSEPAAGATLAVAPAVLVFEFSEALDSDFSRVQLIDSHGRTVDPGPGDVDPSKPTLLRLPVAGFPRDSFTAIWRVRSTVDGHVTTGSVPFGVGIAADPTGLLAAPGAPDPATAPPAPLDAALRGLSLLLLALATGAVPFVWFVWRPACGDARRRKWDVAGADVAMTQVLRRLILIGCTCLALVQVGVLVQQAASAAGVPLAEAIGSPLVALLGGRFGRLWLLRMALVGCLGALAPGLSRAAGPSERRWFLALGVSAGLVLTFSLGGHGAALAERSGRAIAADWLHGMAMVAWLGSMPPLWAAIQQARRDPEHALPLRWLIPNYSALAIVCVISLIWTGILGFWQHIEKLDLLATTTYGRALMVKLGLFGIMIGIGAVNLLVLSRRLRSSDSSLPGRSDSGSSLPGSSHSDNSLPSRFRLTVAAEMIVGAGILLMVGVMTAVAPSKTVWEAELQAGVVERVTVDGVELALRLAPGLVGNNAVAMDLVDPRAGTMSGPATVLLRLSAPAAAAPDAAAAPLQIEAIATPGTGDPLRYAAHGSFFTAPGTWQVEAIVRRSGMDDVRHVFTPRIVRLPSERLVPDAAAAAGLTVASSPASIAAGAALYRAECAQCHGPEGRGDGPEALRLDPPPADLRTHVPLHEGAQLYLFIQQGIAGSAMPAFGETLSHDEIWHVVNHLRASYGE
jgi:copper transport protein